MANKLVKLRDIMAQIGFNNAAIQAFIVTNHDPHLSEYISASHQRLKYLSGFAGSAGTAVITQDKACLWTDGRYFIQAEKEMDPNWKLMKLGVHGTPSEASWLCSELPAGSFVGSDPQLMSYTTWLSIHKELQTAGISLVALPFNFVDRIWDDKPVLTTDNIVPFDVKYAGYTCGAKLKKVRSQMTDIGIDMLVLSSLDDIAWLLNLRGNDISFNPVFYSYVVLTLDSVNLFIDDKKMTLNLKEHFKKDNISDLHVHRYEYFYEWLTKSAPSVKKCWICQSANYLIYNVFPESVRFCECSPVSLLKAIKNDAEVQGMINAHIKDGIALCRFFSWLETAIETEPLTEISVAKVLENFRKDEVDYVGPSFATISSSGPNAAITHYSPKSDSDRPLSRNEIYLCDSGGQYLDGTTDVTRTVHFGDPTDFQKDCFTRVFKGVVSLGTAVFPFGIKGNCLDTLARKHLWDVGLDYKHGTGHGIGSYLCVHEGPMGISWRPYPDDPGLQPNMFLSNEPGYYHEGEFGIRIENIVQVIPAKTTYEMPIRDKGFLTFDTTTMCPIQTKLLNISQLNDAEVNFINSYHKKIRDTLGPILQKRGLNKVYDWLKRETVPVYNCLERKTAAINVK